MGDVKRFEVFADYIEETFPASKYRRVLDVAGGGGCLALELADRGYVVEVVDPRGTMPAQHAKRGLMGKITRRLERFTAGMAKGYDLVVGLHPDGATQEIVRAVEHCPVLVVPCCNYWAGHHGDVANACRTEFKKMGACLSETTLPMKGRNILLRGQR